MLQAVSVPQRAGPHSPSFCTTRPSMQPPTLSRVSNKAILLSTMQAKAFSFRNPSIHRSCLEREVNSKWRTSTHVFSIAHCLYFPVSSYVLSDALPAHFVSPIQILCLTLRAHLYHQRIVYTPHTSHCRPSYLPMARTCDLNCRSMPEETDLGVMTNISSISCGILNYAYTYVTVPHV